MCAVVSSTSHDDHGHRHDVLDRCHAATPARERRQSSFPDCSPRKRVLAVENPIGPTSRGLKTLGAAGLAGQTRDMTQALDRR